MFYKSAGHRYTWKSTYQHTILLLAYVNVTEHIFLIDVKPKEGNPSTMHIFLVHILFGIPFLCLQLFIGKFSRMGCLVFGRMMPIMIGLGYSIILVAWYQLIVYGSLTTLIIHYLISSLSSELPWEICKTKWTETCMDSQRSKIINCTSDTMLSSELYFRYNFASHEITNMKISGIGQFNVFTCICLLSVWFTVFVICQRKQDFNFSMRWTVGAQLVFNLLLTILICIARGKSSFFIKFDENQLKSLFVRESWQRAIYLVFRSVGLHYGVNLLFGSYMKMEHSVYNVAIIQETFIYLLSLQNAMFVSTSCEIIKEKTNCDIFNLPIWEASMRRKIFVLIPFALGYLGIPQFWSFIYFCSCLFMSLHLLITRICFLYCCLADEYSQAQFYRSYIYGFFCLIGFVLDIPTISNLGFPILEIVFYKISFRNGTVILLLTSVTVCLLYGVQRFSTDIHFMTGNKPPLYWKICWHSLFFIMVFEAFALRNPLEKDSTGFYETTLENIRIILQFLIFLPIGFGICFEIFRKFRAHNLPALFIPNEFWGPPNKEERKSRQLFHPKTETRCNRLVDSCDHNCLHKSAVLQRIVELESTMRSKYLKQDDSLSHYHLDNINPKSK